MESAGFATADDIAPIGELARLAIEEKVGTRGGDMWIRRDGRREPIEESLGPAVSEPDRLLVSGRIDEVVVGYAAVEVEELSDGGRLGVLTDLFTHPDARGVGVGEAMMDVVIAWCGDQGCTGVDSVALPGDRHTKNFFETFGMVARAIIVHRDLE